MDIRLKLTGDAQVLAALKRLETDAPQAFAAALYQEAEIEMEEAKRRVPVDTGALRDSGHVQPPVVRGGRVSLTMGFGGPAAPYAVPVHENLEAFHKVGQAKYLESVVLESSKYMAQRVARRAAALMAGGI